MSMPTDAQKRANRNQNKKRSSDPKAKRTPIWLDPPTVRTLDKKCKRTGEDRVAFVRRVVNKENV